LYPKSPFFFDIFGENNSKNHNIGSRCDILINGQIVSTAVSDRKNDARDAAQIQALQKLSRTCFTVVIKSQA
jgi:hypothetical protein